jgi:hypothetical protein
MRPTEEQMKARSITPSIFDRAVRWGLLDPNGNSRQWSDHQRVNHNAQFEEPRERKAGPKKFKKETR